MFKKFISVLSVILIISWIVRVEAVEAKEKETYFVVTAYYSPLPDQKYYLKGNYSAEIRLNWEGIAWASWEKVFPWMLAAPKKYAFWTVIQLDGIWTWVVHDRWGAIVPAGQRGYSYDRIDVWMGYWEEGLKRALTWWKRTVKWKVVWIDKKERGSIVLERFDSKSSALNSLTPSDSIYAQSIWKWTWKEKVLELQRLLRRKWIYSWELDWIYNSKLISELTDFQVKKEIIPTHSSLWAGYWWPKTRKTVANLWTNDWALPSTNKYEEYKDLIVVEEEYEEAPEVASAENFATDSVFNKNIWPYSSKEDIKLLQEMLTRLEAYSWEIDWKYDSVKKDFINYQLDKSVIFSKSDSWAGYWWPKTKSQAKIDLEVIIAIEKQREAEAEAEIKRKEFVKNKTEEIRLAVEKRVDSKMAYIGSPRYGQATHWTRDLQIILQMMGYFKAKDTAYYWDLTKDAIIEFQIDKWVISSKKSKWAWIYNSDTRKALREELIKILVQWELDKSNLVLAY